MRDELVVCSHLQQETVLDHRHAIGVVSRVQAVRDRDDGPALQN